MMTATLTPQAAEGERRKLGAHALLAARRELFVLRGRRALQLALLDKGDASADDVRDAVSIPNDMNPVLFGAVPGALARAGIIRRIGFAETGRAAAHARPVAVWELRDRAAAERWLRDHPPPSENNAGPAVKSAEPEPNLFS